MNLQEFNYNFDTLLNSHSGLPIDIVCDEYEKSVFLTQAENEIFTELYTGKNAFYESFEISEELRRQLDALIRKKMYSKDESISSIGVSDKSIFFNLPKDLAYITLEQVIFNDESLGCKNDDRRISVYPVTQDEYNRIKDNPFRRANDNKVLRLDAGNNVVELISNYNINNYYLEYLKKPSPIILIDLPDGLTIDGENKQHECELNKVLHQSILNRAITICIASKLRGVAQKEN